jgi:hypothetical protein
MEMKKEVASKLAQLVALADQDMADAVDWFDESDMDMTLKLRDLCVDDDPEPLIEWMTQDGEIADCVQRLVLIAYDEIITRYVRRINELA